MRSLRNPLVAFAHDLLVVPIAWCAAFWLRFNLETIPEPMLDQCLRWMPLVVLIQAAAFKIFGLYRGHWRFASMPDLVRILKAVVVGTLCVLGFLFLTNRLVGMPRSVFPLYLILLATLLGGPRFIYRWLKDRRLYLRAGKRVLVCGAGRGGEMLVRDMLRDPESELRPVAFVDDSSKKRGLDIHGLRVKGDSTDIPHLVEELEIDLVIIAIPSAESRQIRRVVNLCEDANVEFRMLPRMEDLVAGRVSVASLRELAIEDLLGRDPVRLDWEAITRGVAAQTVLVSGGGGSIGSELCRQLARLAPKQLVIVDASEFNLYQIEMELRQRFPSVKLEIHLVSVIDRVAVNQLLARYRPEFVFHAAAYKHVPMLQHQVRAAIRNNVIGTRVLAEAAAAAGVGTFVLISTDKAVNPTNTMGASKRFAEMVCLALDESLPTRFITVRFGNVLGSAGSVVPLFRQQIANGGPVTVTHPDVTRYFMTIPEACQLILQAASMGEGGEIYVLDMGEPIKIAYLAELMIKLSGKESEIDIEYIGLRPGEKLYEELFHEKEDLIGTAHGKILQAQSRTVDRESIEMAIAEARDLVDAHDEVGLAKLLRRVVPELHDPDKSAIESNIIDLAARKAADPLS